MEDPSIKHMSLLTMNKDDMSRSVNMKMALTEENLDKLLCQEYTLSHMCYEADQITLHALCSPEHVPSMDIDQVDDNEDEPKNDISNELLNVEEPTGATCSEYSLELNKSDNCELLTNKPESPKRTRSIPLHNFCQSGSNLEMALMERIDELKKKIINHKNKKRNRNFAASAIVSKEQDKQIARNNLGKNVLVLKTLDLIKIANALKNYKILYLNCNISNFIQVKTSLETYSGLKLFISEMCGGKLAEITFPRTISYEMYQNLIGLIQCLLLKEHAHTDALQFASKENSCYFYPKQNLNALSQNVTFSNYTLYKFLNTSQCNVSSIEFDRSELTAGNKIIEIDEPDIYTNSVTLINDMIPVKSNLKRKIQAQAGTKKNKLIKSGLTFTNVTTFYFERSQGFSSIPTKGGSTLGMASHHFHISTLALEEYEYIKMQGEARRRTNNVLYRKTEAREKQKYVTQALSLNQRIELLESAQVQIEDMEDEDCAYIRFSRASAGCDCKDYCDPDVCGCSLAGIECQVDRPNFPCGCSKENCKNLMGRNEYNHSKVRSHFTKTIRKMKLENKARVSKRKQASPSKILITNMTHEMDVDMFEV